jgi:hypothetical protein
MEIAPAAGRSGFVTYSRIEPRSGRASDGSRQGPILDGIEVPNTEDDFGAAPDVRAEPRTAAQPRRGGAFGMVMVLALVAFAGGVGVLAGSFFFPIAKPTHPGLQKVAAVAAPESATASPAPAEPAAASVPQASPAKDVKIEPYGTSEAAGHDNFNWPEDTTASTDRGKLRESLARKSAAENSAKAPAPRDRPEQEIATAPAIKPIREAAPASEQRVTAEQRVTLPKIAAPAPIAEPVLPPIVASPAPLPQMQQPDIAMAEPQAVQPPVDLMPQGPVADESPRPPADIPEGNVYAANPQPGAPIDGAPMDDGGWHGPADEAAAAPVDGATAEDLDQTYQTALDRWIVLDVRDGRAVVDGRERGVFMVEAGSEIPGVGIVETIKRRHGRWIVVTSSGSIFSAAEQGRRRFWLSRLLR